LEGHPSGREDLGFLASAQELRELDLAGCVSLAIEGVQALKQLRRLDLQDTYLAKVRWVDGQSQPDSVDLLPQLASLEHLEELNLRQTREGRPLDLAPIAELKHLRRLDLGGTTVKDVTVLRLPSLESVTLPGGIATEDFDRFVRQHPQLRRLGQVESSSLLANPPRASLTGVRTLRKLNVLEIPIMEDEVAVLEGLTGLTFVCLVLNLDRSVAELNAAVAKGEAGYTLNLDSAATRSLISLRGVGVGGGIGITAMRVPATWHNVFMVGDTWTMSPATELVGLPGDRGVYAGPFSWPAGMGQ
jgi:hypothetical protein